jgi:hypothetical protein
MLDYHSPYQTVAKHPVITWGVHDENLSKLRKKKYSREKG